MNTNYEHQQSIGTEQLVKTIEEETNRLLPTLPTGKFINKPPEIDRFLVRIWPDGTLYFKGSRERIEEFLHLCDLTGLEVHVDHISLCG